MILARDPEEAHSRLVGRILEGKSAETRFGKEKRTGPVLVVIENPEYSTRYTGEEPYTKRYRERIDPLIEKGARKLEKAPYSRRVSFPVWRPTDHHEENPPALGEVTLMCPDGRVHATGFFRSMNALDYFLVNHDFLLETIDEASLISGLPVGSVGMLISIPHVYERDLERARSLADDPKEVYGVAENTLGTHIKAENLAGAWHSVVEAVHNHGIKKKTEWGELFPKQEESRALHRCFIEVENPGDYGGQVHDKAPFTREYGIDYGTNYVLGGWRLEEPFVEGDPEAGKLKTREEEYTYAERARYTEKDREFFGEIVDQWWESIKKLGKNEYDRRAYIGISRPWDLDSSEPPCLRGWQLFHDGERPGMAFFMRSNDAFGALASNMFGFWFAGDASLRAAGMENPDIARYYHLAVDMHVYGDSFEAAREIVAPKTPSKLEYLGVSLA